jgi:hypothetical protein
VSDITRGALLAAIIANPAEVWDGDAGSMYDPNESVADDLIEYQRTNDLDAETVAHFLWTMGAQAKHPRCPYNDGGNGDYSCACRTCEKHLVRIGRKVLRASQPEGEAGA